MSIKPKNGIAFGCYFIISMLLIATGLIYASTMQFNMGGGNTVAIDATGDGSGFTNLNPSSLTFSNYQFNFVSGQRYTNTYAFTIGVGATCSLTVAALTGTAQMDLVVVGINTNSFIQTTALGVVVGSGNSGQLQDTILSGQIYYFTNQSVGAGNASSIKAGSGKIQLW